MSNTLPPEVLWRFFDEEGDDDWAQLFRDSSPVVLSSAAHELLERARALSTGTDPERQLSVIFAHSACEFHTELMLVALVRHTAPALADAIVELLPRDVHLGNESVRGFYSTLTGDDPGKKETRAGWWDEWKLNRRFRNDVAHTSVPVTKEQAARSVDLGADYMKHLTGATALALRSRR